MRKEVVLSPKSQLLLIARSDELLKRNVEPAHNVSSATEKETLGEMLTLIVL